MIRDAQYRLEPVFLSPDSFGTRTEWWLFDDVHGTYFVVMTASGDDPDSWHDRTAAEATAAANELIDRLKGE